MTPLEFLERQQEKAQFIEADHVVHILDKPEHLAILLLLMSDGFRGLGAYCLSVDGTMIIFEDHL